MKMSTSAQPSSSPQPRSSSPSRAPGGAGGGFSSALEKRSSEVSSAEGAPDAVAEAVERAEEAEVFSGSMLYGDDGKEGKDEKSRQQREALQKRRKIALAALDALVSTDPKLTPPPSLKAQASGQAPVVTEAVLDGIVSDVQLALRKPQEPSFRVSLKDGALKGLQFRVIHRPEGIQVIFLSDATEIRSLLRLHVDRLTKSLRDRNIVVRTIDIRDPEEDERERRHQRQRDAEEQASRDDD